MYLFPPGRPQHRPRAEPEVNVHRRWRRNLLAPVVVSSLPTTQGQKIDLEEDQNDKPPLHL